LLAKPEQRPTTVTRNSRGFSHKCFRLVRARFALQTSGSSGIGEPGKELRRRARMKMRQQFCARKARELRRQSRRLAIQLHKYLSFATAQQTSVGAPDWPCRTTSSCI